MKILVFTPWFPTEQKPNSGVFVKDISMALKNAGHEVELVHFTATPSKKIWRLTLKDEEYHGLMVHRMNISSVFWRIFWHLPGAYYTLCKKSLSKLVAQFTPDLIHCHVVFPTGIFANNIAKNDNIPYVITEHWSRISGFLTEHPARNSAKRAYFNARNVIAVSEYLSAQISDQINDLNIRIIGNIVDDRIFKYTPKSDNQKTIEFTVVSSWNEQKNITKRPDLVVHALAEVQKNSEKKIRLEVIGGGNKINELKEIAQNKGIEITLKGYQDKSYINQRLQKSDFFLHASQIETFGIVCVEALLTGTPIVVSDVGALTEWVNEKNGVLAHNNVDSWKNAILQAMQTPYNHEFISNEIRGRFSEEQVVDEYQELFKEMRASQPIF